MSDTNEIRKAIMDRLGSVAKFSTTHEDLIAELRRLTEGKHTGEWHTIANTWLSRKRATGNREIATEANRAYDFVEREMLARMKQRSSRPGAKAEFGLPIYRKIGRGIWRFSPVGQNNWELAYLYTNGQFVTIDRNFAGTESQAIAEAKKEGAGYPASPKEGWEKYVASRPGAKAKFGMQKGSEFVLGEYSVRLLSDLTNYMGNAKAKTAMVSYVASGQQATRGNIVLTHDGKQVSLYNPGGALIRSGAAKFSRPGAKAKMQKEYVLWGIPKGKTSALDEQVLSTQAKTPAQMDAIKKRAAADGWHSFRVQVLDLSKPYTGFSRPGAKAKFGNADALLSLAEGYVADGNDEAGLLLTDLIKMRNRGLLSQDQVKHLARIIRDGQAMGVFSRLGAKAEFADVGSNDNKIRYLLGEAESAIRHGMKESVWREFVERAELLVQDETPVALRERIKRVKASMSRPGVKSTHAHSEAVSKKIALLMKEGKPQAQAVAIALDMERRGEL